ncbi:hypothetical protein F0562_016457 [Nyssa sinensis]|uniref:NAC domain-containing protein n=1 Tax=Nyssa sinensis TaxID=561372 RepID=A0A5J4ZL99_9ASTE|nr:hypothetical protein F0562_016457 [Nyssa sinensis]
MRQKSKLDDWVLCRVRQKSSIPQSLWEDRYGSSSEAASYFPKADKPCSMNTDPNLEMIREYLYKECPMLPYIFDSRDLPCMDTDSSISFEGGKTSPSVCEDNSDSKHLQHSVLQFDSLYNSRKRKSIEGDQYDSFIQPKKQLSNRDDQNQEAILAENNHNSTTGMNFHSTDQFEGNNFNVDQWNFLIQCQDQGHLAFT